MFPDLGLESTPQEFIHNMVVIFREIRRVLRDDGVVWLNLGDSYSGSGGPGSQWDNKRGIRGADDFVKFDNPNRKRGPGAGSLMMMPHRIAIALQDDGWIVRNDVVWWKRNPMPESQAGWRFERKKERIKSRGRSAAGIDKQENMGAGNPHASRDGYEAEYEYLEDHQLRKGSWRHTRAHEFVFQLVKGPKMKYWANQEAVRETYTEPLNRWGGDKLKEESEKHSKYLDMMGISPSSALRAGRPLRPNSSGRNPRSVMDVPTRAYKGAHYATFPPNLIAPLIRATCPRWACPVCGQGWSPVVEKQAPPIEVRTKTALPRDEIVSAGFRKDKIRYGSGQKLQNWLDANPPQVKEYRPTCEHDHTKDEAVPGIVLDPFVGSGTTVMVAKQLLRRGIGLDISMEYIDQQAKIRTGEGSPSNVLDDLPLFAELKS